MMYANKGIENFFGILYLILLLYRDHSTLNLAGATVLIVCHHISTSALETQLLNSHPHNNVALWDFKFLIRLLVSNYFSCMENSLKKCCFSLVKLFKWTDLRKVKPFQKVFRLLSHFIYFFSPKFLESIENPFHEVECWWPKCTHSESADTVTQIKRNQLNFTDVFIHHLIPLERDCSNLSL